ncbi:hypothetical protein J6590_024764, partial [Homalodisca vitripennis]
LLICVVRARPLRSTSAMPATDIDKVARVDATVIADLVGKHLSSGDVFGQFVTRITHELKGVVKEAGRLCGRRQARCGPACFRHLQLAQAWARRQEEASAYYHSLHQLPRPADDLQHQEEAGGHGHHGAGGPDGAAPGGAEEGYGAARGPQHLDPERQGAVTGQRRQQGSGNPALRSPTRF